MLIRIFYTSILLSLIWSSLAAQDGEAPEGSLARPVLTYNPEDRTAILKRVAPGKPSFTPTAEDKNSTDPVKNLLANYRFEFRAEESLVKSNEERRSDLVMKLAILTWLDPSGEYPHAPKEKKTTYIDSIRSAIGAITEPELMKYDFLTDKGEPNKPGQWNRYLEASVSLWNYAIAYDLLATPEVRAAGLKDEDLALFYNKLSNGVVRLLVNHLRSYQGWKDATGPIGNNWNSREFSGVGLALLSLRDQYEKEPQFSPRSNDYLDGLKALRDLFPKYLNGWGGPARGDGAFCNYYEGPHYLRYWVEYGLAFGVAWSRAFPNDPLNLLKDGGPISRFCRAHTIWCAPTGRKDKVAEWTCVPVDDTWTYPDEYSVPVMLAAAWIKYPDADRAEMIASVKRNEIRSHSLLLAHPILDELNDGKAPPPLPLIAGIKHDGIGVARTSGENEKALSVFAKNFETPLEKDGTPSLSGHTHSDNGEVVAYRDGEVVLVDPAYGPKGFANKSVNDTFTGWEHRNTLCVEEPGDSGKFVLPVFKEYGPHDRLSRAESVKDDLGEFRVLEMTTPAHRRTVIVPGDSCILIVDRLNDARRVKLCWWGNGSVTGRENEGVKSKKPWEGDAAKVVTAEIDTEKAEAVYFRGPALASRIRVILPGGQTATQVPGEYGPKWYNTNFPLTGLHAVSKTPVHYTVTLVELAPKPTTGAPAFKLTAEVKADDAGKIQSVTVSGGEKPIEYRITADGKVERSAK